MGNRRPLDRFDSIKLKLGLVIVAAVLMTVVLNEVGIIWGLTAPARLVLAVGFALLLVQVLAHGMTLPLREMAAASRAMAGGDYSLQVTATSSDELGELARAFNAMAAELAETDRFRRDLVANVSHELRTPVSALRARLENLIDGVEAPDPELLSTMLAQVERLGRLVKQLLDLSRLEAGTMPLDRHSFPVRAVLEDVAREARLSDPSAVVQVETPEGLVVEADAERLHQVVANLLANALRHSPPGEPVRMLARAEAGQIAIEVLDRGPGIGSDEVERVFERFYRADAARSANDGGAGLGLAIAQWIVDLHGGTIRPEPNDPSGCRMVVTLPVSA